MDYGRFHPPVSTAFADGSAKSSAVLPSVLRILGSAPCCNNTKRAGIYLKFYGGMLSLLAGMQYLKTNDDSSSYFLRCIYQSYCSAVAKVRLGIGILRFTFTFTHNVPWRTMSAPMQSIAYCD